MTPPYLYNGNSYTGKTSSYWDGPLGPVLTLKQLSFFVLFFQNDIWLSNVVHYYCNVFVWKLSNISSVLCILIAWCIGTRASTARA